MIYLRQDRPIKKGMKHKWPHDIEGIFIELNFRKIKWLLFGTYHPPLQYLYYFEALEKPIDTYNNYNKVLLAGDFNSAEHGTCMGDFLCQQNLKNIVNESTCFKNPLRPSAIDLFSTNISS